MFGSVSCRSNDFAIAFSMIWKTERSRLWRTSSSSTRFRAMKPRLLTSDPSSGRTIRASKRKPRGLFSVIPHDPGLLIRSLATRTCPLELLFHLREPFSQVLQSVVPVFPVPRPGGVGFPPIHPHLHRLVHGADDEADLDRQKLDIHQLHLDVAGDHDPFVENALQDVRQRRACECVPHGLFRLHGFHPLQEFPKWAEINVEIFFLKTKLLAQPPDLFGLTHEREAKPFDLLLRERTRIHPADGLFLQEFVEQLDEGQHELTEAVLDIVGVDFHAGAPHREGRTVLQVWRTFRCHILHPPTPTSSFSDSSFLYPSRSPSPCDSPSSSSSPSSATNRSETASSRSSSTFSRASNSFSVICPFSNSR